MDGLLDRASPRRGSLTSLHRQPSGSFSHGPKLSPSLQVNNANLYSLCKDLDKFTRYFIIKTVQVIVQSRIGGNKKVKTDCKPNGNDWFNINISDITEISDRTKAALDTDGFSVKSNWRVCCEISLRTSDGGRVVLEHWIISNKTNFNSNQKLNNSQASPRGCMANRSSATLLTSSNNGGTVPLAAINSSSTSAKVRPATIGNTSRTRLNSIDDCTSDNNFAANKLLMGVNNENVDIKTSTSCFSLSSAPTNPHNDTNNALITASPSTNSLNCNSNTTQDQSTHSANNSSSQQQGSTKTSATSSIYTIYNRMSLLLKTLMTTTHIVPAYRLASRTSQTDSCKICYRVYTSPAPYQNSMPRASIEDISYNSNSESPNKRSFSSNSSFGSVNIREFVGPDEIDYFCPILKLGSIRTDINELEVSLCYRTDMRSSNHLLKSPRSKDVYNRILDEDCITAAKQLLAGNDYYRNVHTKGEHLRAGSNNSINLERNTNETLDFLDQPLRPAFADADNKEDKHQQDPNFGIIESAFEGLLKNKDEQRDDNLVGIALDTIGECPSKKTTNCKGNNRSTNAQSEPIQVPTGPHRAKHQELCRNLSSGSTPKSLTDSYVFVDLNPPFASEEQNDINSFFHGPSPAFSNGFDSLKDVEELTNQLAVIEANASQIDDFVDNICASEDEEEEGVEK